MIAILLDSEKNMEEKRGKQEKERKKWGEGGDPGPPSHQGHIINQSIDPRGNNNPTQPLISKQ